jgi:hypothetical protein
MGLVHLALLAVLSAWPVPSTSRGPAVSAAPGASVTPAPPAAPPIPAPPAVDLRPPVPAAALEPAAAPEPSAPPAATADLAPVTASDPASTSAPGAQLTVHATAAPGKARQPLYKKWWFWTIAGALFTGVVTITYVETRPPPSPYRGSTMNGFNVITLP